MIDNEAYILDRTCEYKGETYRVLSELDNNLLLVVKKSDFEKGEFPLTPVVIPDEYMINFYKQEEIKNK